MILAIFGYLVLFLLVLFLCVVVVGISGEIVQDWRDSAIRRQQERAASTVSWASLWVWWTGVLFVGSLILWAVGRMG
jgi:hypothetical protein